MVESTPPLPYTVTNSVRWQFIKWNLRFIMSFQSVPYQYMAQNTRWTVLLL